MPGYQSLAGQLNDLQTLPRPSDRAYHWPTVANSALSATMEKLLNAEASSTQIQALEEQFSREFKPGLPPGVYKRSVERGQAISQAIIQWAASDGYEIYKNCPYLPPAGAGLWQPTPPGFRPPLLPCWGKLRPFVLNHGSECSPGPPITYSEDPNSEFYQEALEVYSVVNHLNSEQLAIAQFWADSPGQTGTPPGHSISILSQILIQEGSSLETAAEAYARIGIALADSFISCWQTKYQYNLLRPITYIHNVIGDSGWSTLVVTPPFPEYPSGHSVQSAAAAQVLTEMFGEIAFIDNTHASLGYAPRMFISFFAFAEEAAISRLYGGIHYRAAIERGLEQGRCIGQRVNALEFKTP
jgi:PAP2 superfamily